MSLYVLRQEYDAPSEYDYVYLTECGNELTFFVEDAMTFERSFDAFKYLHEIDSDFDAEVIQIGYVDLDELINL